MDFKNLLGKLDQLNEAEMTSRKVAGKAYGGAAQHDDEDDEDDDGKKKAAAPAVKRGRGRPRKVGGEAETQAKYSGAAELQKWIVGNVPKKSKELEKLGKTKHKLSDKEPTKKKVKESLMDYINELDKILAEAEQLTIEPAKASTQVIKQGTKVLGQVANPQLANTIKQAIGKGEMSLAGSELGEDSEDYSAKKARAGKDIGKPGKQFAKIAKSAGERYGSKERGEKVAGAVLAKLRSKTNEADIYTDGMNSLGAGLGAGRSDSAFESKKGVAEGKSAAKKDDKAEKAGAKVAKDIEYDEKVKDKIHGKKRHSEDEKAEKAGKKVAKDIEYDEKKSKKKVDEGMDQRLKAAHHRGKSHALAKESYHCRYDEGSEEARMYHEGYKMGLDECYGIMPMRGVVVGEDDMDEGMMGAALGGVAGAALGKTPSAAMTGAELGSTAQDMFANEDMDQDIVDDMASFGAHTPAIEEDDVMELSRGEYMKQQARKTPGDTFKAFGQTMRDADVLENDLAFESWDNQLNELLTEGEKVEEGMSISVSKGQQGMPDSVSVTASDAEADKLMALVKQLGVFGAEASASDYGTPDEKEMVHQHGDLEVVDDHDGMLALMKKMSGQDSHEDYADEMGGHDDSHGEVCDACGMQDCECDHEQTCEACGGVMEAGHSCGDKEMVDEVESEDQMEFEVAEDNQPDSDEAETSADEQAEAEEDAAIAKYRSADKDITVNEEQLDEWANDAGKDGTDAAFMRDIEFMTKTIAGGLNKEKSTGQTTIPVIAGQSSRMGVDGMNEGSLADLKKLSGIR